MSGAGDDPRYPVQAPGWAALDRALAMVYPGQVPHQFASQRAYDLEGTAPLPAVSVYEGRGPDHWHLVSYGLTELFDKSSPDPERSGFGFELTLRLPRGEGEEVPPGWAVQLLQALGHYVLSGHGPLDSGHVIDLGGPLGPPVPSEQGPRPSALEGVVCVPDPQLGKIDTPFGSVLFLQLFGLTRDELEPMGSWPMERKVGLVREAYPPLGITDPARGSMQDDRRKAAVFRRYALGIMI
ncbi:MAG: suppressor of fused domain protein [Myxococcales bacterium]|nr:suppressor of fused domain protein [Myxococcales bacterium]